jgi:16S rRNA (adenine1518-N6/adenine1519-N6)-dimethyltransferase
MENKSSIPSPNKNLGQHYLNNITTIEKICQDFNGLYDGIIEVGPGPGTLTKTLSKMSMPLILIEKDSRFSDILQNLSETVSLHQTDALEVKAEDIFLEGRDQQSWWFVSNLPYNVGTPIMLKYLRWKEIKYFTLMFQREVAQKVCIDMFGEKQKQKEMNSLYALVSTYFNIEHLVNVPPGHFSPPPKVDSAVISLTRKTSSVIPLEAWANYERFLRVLFGQRRKQIGKILKQISNQKNLTEVFEKLQIQSTLRSERLTLNQVHDLYLCLRTNHA